MSIWGKILGGAAGLAIGGPIGGVIGAVAGHAYDRYREEEQRSRRRTRLGDQREGEALGRGTLFDDPTETRRIAFATAIVVLGAKLAKADGRVTRDEIQAFRQRFMISDQDVGDVAKIYDQAKTSAEGFEPYARQIAVLFGHDSAVLEELLIGLFEVARADGDLRPAEIEFLRRVAEIFGFGSGAFEQIRARYSAAGQASVNADDAYAILGVRRSASDEEIKRTYRTLVREHHPDRLLAKGLPEEFIERANQRVAAINAAYDRIAKQRKLK